jgi:hypothetical protein
MEKHVSAPAPAPARVVAWEAQIFSDLRAAGPPANIVLAHGRPAASVTRFALHMAFAGIAREKPVVYLDGGNSFDPFLISKVARHAGLAPEDLLKRIYISRAFTCHQMHALVVDRLAGALNEFGADVAIVSGLLNTFYDEDVRFGEAYDLLKGATAEFARLAQGGARILLACPDTKLPLASQQVDSRQRRFVNLLKTVADKALRIEGKDGETTYALEKPRVKNNGSLTGAGREAAVSTQTEPLL